MNYYQQLLENIKTKSCYISRDYYPKNKAIVYQFIVIEPDNTKTIFCEMAGNVAYMLKRETGVDIIEKNYTALNFKPVPVPFNCIRTLI